MKKDDIVIIRKLSAVADSRVPTPLIQDFVLGQDNPGLSVPVDYTVHCQLTRDISVGEPILGLRFRRNGVEELGFFRSTPVISIEVGDENLFVATANSVYEVCLFSTE